MKETKPAPSLLRAAWLLALALCLANPSPARAADYLTDAKAMLQKGDLLGAQIALRNLVRDQPENAEAHFRLGGVFLNLGDGATAEGEIRRARDMGYDVRAVTAMLIQTLLIQRKFQVLLMEVLPTGKDPVLDAEIYLGRAQAHVGKGETAAARDVFRMAAQASPDSLPGLSASMRLAAQEQDWAEVLRKVDLILAADPANSFALIWKAQSLRNDGKIEEALALLDKAIAGHPDQASQRLERVRLLIAQNRDELASKEITAIVTMVPRSIPAILMQAYLQVRAKDYKRADTTLQRISREIANVPRGLYLLAVIKQNLGQLEQAVEAARKYTTRVPRDPAGAKLLARLQMESKRPDLAVEALIRLAEANVQDAELYNLLGNAYSVSGQAELAVQSFQKAASLAPDNSSSRFRLARAHMAMGQVEEAASDLEQSLQLAPSSAMVGAALFFAELATGDLAKAEKAFKQIRVLQGDTPVVWNLEGILKLSRRDYQGARDAFSHALAGKPDFVSAQVNLARVALLQDQDAEAGRLLGEILAHDTGSEPALTMEVARLVRRREFAAASQLLEKALAARPDRLRTRLLLAELYERDLKLSKAIAVLTPSSDLPPTAELFAALARIHIADGADHQARESYNQALALEPGALQIRRQLIRFLVGKREFELARSVIEAGLRVDPRNEALMEDYLRVDFEDRGMEGAIATAERLRRQGGEVPMIRALRGDAYFIAGKYERAIEDYEKELKSATSGFLQQRLARAYAAQGNSAKAEQTLRDWVAKDPADLQSLRFLAGLNMAMHNWDQAQALLWQLLQVNPRDGVILNELALAYQAKGDRRARELAEKAYLLLPTAQTADTLGWILLSDADAVAAVPLLRQAALSQPGNPALRYHYAAALARTGRKTEAADILKQTIAESQAFPERSAAQKVLDDLEHDRP